MTSVWWAVIALALGIVSGWFLCRWVLEHWARQYKEEQRRLMMEFIEEMHAEAYSELDERPY